jgi:hypothetical protein
MPLQATSGAASYDAFGGGVPVVPNYIEEVFSTWLYTGNDPSTQDIINGIDLSTKGGMVWQKARSSVGDNVVTDTVRGLSGGRGKELYTNTTGAENVDSGVTAFYTNGFRAGANGPTNGSGKSIASWTFRKQPKFFDVVTYTGTGSNTTIAHNLGSVPACIMVKRTDSTGDWQVYHRSLANTEYLVLNTTAAKATGATRWNSTTPTSTVFSLGTDATVNASGGTYVAYLFAHNAGGFGLTGTDNVVSCGSYTGNGGTQTVTLGYEPQWVLIKNSDGGASGTLNWNIIDNMRGMPVGSNDNVLFPNISDAEVSSQRVAPTATGFTIGSASGNLNDNGAVYIYIAIRRGPMKVPTSGTSVFSPIARSGTGATSTVSNSIKTDLLISMVRNTAGLSSGVWDRLRGFAAYLETTGTASESTSSDSVTAMNNTAYVLGADSGTDRINRSGYTYANWTFSRAPNFFDEVCWTSTGSTFAVNHNLNVVPQLIILKWRSGAQEMRVFFNETSTGSDLARLNSDAAATTYSYGANWGGQSTATTITPLGSTSGRTFVAFLFATCAGVSKVGTYTGTATTKQVDCGFTAGARFVLIKRTDSTGDWYVWDSARGIVSGNDPYLLLNSTAAEVTSTDYIDTYSAGFEISSTAPSAINASGGTFIFLAIA